MSLRSYDYSCQCGVHESVIVEYEERDDWSCDDCGEGERLMCAPVVQTLETHMRGYKGDGIRNSDIEGYWNPGFGEFVDENLTNPATGDPIKYTSLADKRRKLKQANLYEKPPKPSAKKRAIFDGSSHRGSKKAIGTK